jgi:hypothetical protein
MAVQFTAHSSRARLRVVAGRGVFVWQRFAEDC